LIRPDGVDLAISFNASDQFGRSGIPGEVDNKYSSIVANSLLTSVIAVAATAAAQSLVSDTASTTTTNATQGTTTVTADATNQAINNVSGAIVNTVSQIVNNALDVTPIIRVPQGTRITVIVNADIKVPFIDGRER
jgi:type IV secretion system protein VirB10